MSKPFYIDCVLLSKDMYQSQQCCIYLRSLLLPLDQTLAALTIMIAESDPDEKEMMIKVIMNCMV